MFYTMNFQHSGVVIYYTPKPIRPNPKFGERPAGQRFEKRRWVSPL